MYGVADLAAEGASLRTAVASAQPFRPLMVKIKLTRRCNLACPMCGFWCRQGEDSLACEQVVRILGELATLGCRKVHYSGGEPTLRLDLPDLIAAARRLKLRVTLTTNATLLNHSLCKRLLSAGLRSVNVSLDAPDPRLHDRMRGTRRAFKHAVAGVRMLQRVAEERGVALAVRMNAVVSRWNYHALAGLPALARELGVSGLLLRPVDDASGRLLLKRRRLMDYNPRIAPALAEAALASGLLAERAAAYPFGITRRELRESRFGLYAHGLYERQPCYAPWTHAQIQADGRVVPCCMANVTLGDLTQQTFAEVWQGEPYHALRARLATLQPLPDCARCDTFCRENMALHRICEGEGTGGSEGTEETGD